MKLQEQVRKLGQSCQNALFPVRCLLCGVVGQRSPCEHCAVRKLEPTKPTLPKVPFGVTAVFAATAYEHDARSLITALKYRGEKPIASGLAALMATSLPDDLEVDLITWAPTSVARRRKRGFDQAELLAVELGQLIGTGAMSTLERLPGTSSQTGRSFAQRQGGVRFAMHPGFGGGSVPVRSVLLVDDVVTSGATMSAAARVLRDFGVREVWGVCAAFTPRHDPISI